MFAVSLDTDPIRRLFIMSSQPTYSTSLHFSEHLISKVECYPVILGLDWRSLECQPASSESHTCHPLQATAYGENSSPVSFALLREVIHDYQGTPTVGSRDLVKFDEECRKVFF